MMPDTTPQDTAAPELEPTAPVGQVGEAVQAVAAEATAELETATAAVADGAEAANQDGARASRAAADAFGEARERLNAMAATLPSPAADAFQARGAAFGKGLESSYTTAMEGVAEFNSKAIAAWRSNAESTIRHWQSLAAVKSLSEAISLSAEHTRRQLEAVTSQTRELSALATRIVREAADPLKITGR